jgi:hypothetical protein
VAFTADNSTQDTLSDSNIDTMIKRSAVLLFAAHSSLLLASTQGLGLMKMDKSVTFYTEQEEKAFQEKVHSLSSLLQETLEHIKVLNMTSPQITAFYHFGVELLCWVLLVVQSWVENQKKKNKKEKREWLKSALEPFIITLHDVNTTLATLSFQDYKAQDQTDVFPTETTKELQSGVDTVAREINTSHKQSHTTFAAILSTRLKVLTSLKL